MTESLLLLVGRLLVLIAADRHVLAHSSYAASLGISAVSNGAVDIGSTDGRWL